MEVRAKGNVELFGVNDKLVVVVIKEEKKTEGGIVVPDSVANEPQSRCSVLSKGKDVSPEIEVGNTILCHPHAGMDIMLDGKIFKVLKNEEVYAVLN